MQTRFEFPDTFNIFENHRILYFHMKSMHNPARGSYLCLAALALWFCYIHEMRAVDIYDEHEPTPEQRLYIQIHLNTNCAKVPAYLLFGKCAESWSAHPPRREKKHHNQTTKCSAFGMGVR